MKTTVRLTESAVMIALATVMSMLSVGLTYGGSITICSSLPLVVIAYRHGTKWGLFTGAVYGLLQMLLGLKNVMYFTSPAAVIAVILLDYLVAFAVLGLAGLFRRVIQKQMPAMVLGAAVASLARYILHVISGATVWAGLSIPTEAALIYSLAYNATYMIPETLVLLLGTALIGNMLDFRGEHLGKVIPHGKAFDWLAGAAGLAAVAALIFDVCAVFPHLQDAETGDFIINGLFAADWGLVGLVTAIGAAVVAVLLIIRFAVRRKAA